MSRTFNTLLWGISIALAWTWGIGLFFSVQMAVQFGFWGLVAYASINAFGLSLFGIVNHFLAKKEEDGNSYEKSFFTVSKKFRFAFYFFQFLALTLTLFAVLKYVTLPLKILSILVAVMFLGASIFLGEEFKIQRIKYSHFLIFLGILFTMGYLLKEVLDYMVFKTKNFFVPQESLDVFSSFSNFTELSVHSANIFDGTGMKFGFLLIPIAVGFLVGPWLDLQHWQRAIQIKKEGLNVAASYIVGGVVFWLILISHGFLAISAFSLDKASVISQVGEGFFFHTKSIITSTLGGNPFLIQYLGLYVIFICLAALATFDSGYVALKWYSNELIRDSKSLVLSIIPKSVISSPILLFLVVGVTAITTLHFTELGKFIANFDPSLERFFVFELEYYMAFYASFFVVYAVALLRSVAKLYKTGKKEISSFHFLKLFATGLCSLSIFGIGYFIDNTLIMAFASLIPLVYGLIIKDKTTEFIENSEAGEITGKAISNPNAELIEAPRVEIMHASYPVPENATPTNLPGCYLSDNWFIHTFIPTYQDTNSVGNIYFATYSMWVGKTRELFFLNVLPEFDPKTSDYLILTRSYEHKFVRESKEFERVSVHIRIKDYNRKFVTLEHKILNSQDELLGRGTQSLMFVDSKDYSLIDIPQETYTSFLPYAVSKETV